MNTYQLIAAVLGTLGFVASCISLGWQVRNSRPRLQIGFLSAGVFDVMISIKKEFDKEHGDIPLPVSIISVNIGVANHNRRNSIVSIKCSMSDKLVMVSKFMFNYLDFPIDMFLGPGDKPKSIWCLEDPDWDEDRPLEMDDGGYRNIIMNYQINHRLPDPQHLLTVEILDARRRTIRRSVVLERLSLESSSRARSVIRSYLR